PLAPTNKPPMALPSKNDSPAKPVAAPPRAAAQPPAAPPLSAAKTTKSADDAPAEAAPEQKRRARRPDSQPVWLMAGTGIAGVVLAAGLGIYFWKTSSKPNEQTATAGKQLRDQTADTHARTATAEETP